MYEAPTTKAFEKRYGILLEKTTTLDIMDKAIQRMEESHFPSEDQGKEVTRDTENLHPTMYSSAVIDIGEGGGAQSYI